MIEAKAGPASFDLRADNRISSLDGIRAVSVLLVLFFHGALPPFKNGYVGVDIFFVLSGFLITKILLNEFGRDNTVSMINFYRRRALRLGPALVMMCVAFSIYAVALLPNLGQRLRETTEALLYVSNWSRAFEFGTQHYLGHTWSLGIEEQFYLLWPVALVSILKLRNGYRIAAWTAPVIVATAALWRLWLALHGANIYRLYNGFDTRCDAVLVGCALAFVAPKLSRLWPVGVGGILIVLAALPWYDPLLFEGGYTLIACSAALIIAGALDPQTYIARAFALGPLVAIGRRSYGLYIYHFPIYVLIGEKLGSKPLYLNTIGLGATAVLAALSYRHVELRCLQIPRQAGSWRDLSLACVGPASMTIGLTYIVAAMWFMTDHD